MAQRTLQRNGASYLQKLLRVQAVPLQQQCHHPTQSPVFPAYCLICRRYCQAGKQARTVIDCLDSMLWQAIMWLGRCCKRCTAAGVTHLIVAGQNLPKRQQRRSRQAGRCNECRQRGKAAVQFVYVRQVFCATACRTSWRYSLRPQAAASLTVGSINDHIRRQPVLCMQCHDAHAAGGTMEQRCWLGGATIYLRPWHTSPGPARRTNGWSCHT